MNFEFLKLIDIIGTAAFAISGVFAAMQKKLDLFGIFIIAFITAVGGGTLRDIMLGDSPVTWMRSINYSVIIIASATIAILFNRTIGNFQRTLRFFDSLGLGFFTVLGMQKGIAFDLHPIICIALGTITGCFGGVIRDISLNTIPLVFHKEIYASACIIGGFAYFLLLQTRIDTDWADLICITIIVLTRFTAIRFNLTLPDIYNKSKSK